MVMEYLSLINIILKYWYEFWEIRRFVGISNNILGSADWLPTLHGHARSSVADTLVQIRTLSITEAILRNIIE